MWPFFFSLVILATAVSWLIWFLVKLDCDFTTFYASKLGRPVSRLKGKVIWITGASSGIGEALAYRLALIGAKLIISGTNENALAQVKRKCESLYPGSPDDILALPFDMTDLECHQKKFDQLIRHFGRLDILINNAGRSQRALFKNIDIQVDKKLFEINVFSVVNLSRIVLNYWLKEKIAGHFVITSSTLGKIGLLEASSYAGSKHALHGIFDSIRHENHCHGIKVTFACPGPVFSRAAERAFTHQMTDSFGINHSDQAKRMKTDRCAYLMLVAISNCLDESWIAFQPILIVYYVTQYLPSISRWFIVRLLTPEKMFKLREGIK